MGGIKNSWKQARRSQGTISKHNGPFWRNLSKSSFNHKQICKVIVKHPIQHFLFLISSPGISNLENQWFYCQISLWSPLLSPSLPLLSQLSLYIYFDLIESDSQPHFMTSISINSINYWICCNFNQNLKLPHWKCILIFLDFE